VGFDPYLGFYHQPRYGRPALALDLMEEFRPLVADSVAIGLINNGELRPSDFITRTGAVALTDSGRRRVIDAYERRPLPSWRDRILSSFLYPLNRYRMRGLGQHGL
jgi:CRISPR-associated protein Cas1